MARVLVVDDDIRIRGLIREVLKEVGFSVQTAADGAEALVELQSAPPEVIVLDLQMPVMDGWTFLRQIRDAGDQTPVLILSAYGAQRAQQQLGANDSLPKPFDIDQLIERVTALLPAASPELTA